MSRVPLHNRDRDKIRRGLIDSQRPPLLERQEPHQNLQWVKLDSLTEVSDRFDGQVYQWDAAAGAFAATAIGDVWVEFANGLSPDTDTYYHAQEVGFENDRVVFLVDDFAEAGGAAAHTILNATAHTDSVTQTVSRGSMIVGNATPKWDEVVIGAARTVWRSDGTDPAWSTAIIDNNARVAVSKNSGAVVGTRRELNFIEGTNVTLTIADDAGNEEVDITITAASGSLTVEEVDGSPSLTGITTLRFDQADGFVVSQPGAGIARVDFTAAGSLTVREVDLSPSVSATTILEFDQVDGFVVSNPSANRARVDFPIGGLTAVTPDLSADSFAIHDDSGAVNARVLLNKISFPHLAECRLSLSSSDPVAQNVTSGGSVYLHRYGGSWLALREDHLTTEGSGVWIPRRIAASALGGSLAGLGVGGDGYIYAYWTGSAIALEITSTGTDTVEGVKVQSGDRTRRYVGFVLSGTGSGLAHDNPQFRHLFSWYNRIRKGIRVAVEGAGHTYGSSTERNWNNSAAAVEVCTGPSSDGMSDNIFAIVMSNHNAGAAGSNAYVTLGFNSQTVGALSLVAENRGTARITTTAGRNWCPHEFGGIREIIYILESGDGSNAASFNEVALEGHIVC